jgi:predicted DNA-binding ribbon-helix-helix protein
MDRGPALFRKRQDLPMLQKKSVTLSGHETSLALEPEFWAVLQAMAEARPQSLAALVREIDEGRGPRALASACRVTALQWAGRNGAVEA